MRSSSNYRMADKTPVVFFSERWWVEIVRFHRLIPALLLRVVLVIWIGSAVVLGQPPGTQPPKNLIEGATNQTEDGVPIRAFMFLSESGNPVMMPSLTWEEFERYLNLDSGLETPGLKYSYQSLEISGKASEGRAELEVRLKVTIEPSEQGWINVPLRLGNFHLLKPVVLEPAIESMTSVNSDGSGYSLYVRNDSLIEATVVMNVAARVDQNSSSKSLSFRLPDVPSRVNVQVENDTADAEVLGQGDEILVLEKSGAGEVELQIESSGGEYTLRWGRDSKTVEATPIYQIDSRTTVRWDSPQDQPTATVRLSVNNLRGAVRSFQVRLPKDVVILDSPIIADTGQMVEMGAPQISGTDQLREVTIPSDTKQQRIELSFEYQIPANKASSSSPLLFRVPEVVGSLRHRGDIEVLTPSEYRLRWKSTSWVRSVDLDSALETDSSRSYSFAFDRPASVLPLWLREDERQLRINTRSELTAREKTATLWMQVEITGQTEDGLLRFDDAGWEVRIVESQLGTPLITFREEGLRVVDLSSLSTEEGSQLIFQFQKVLPEQLDPQPLTLNLPRITVPESTEVIRNAVLDLVNDGRKAFVVDLEASRGLTRMSAVEVESNTDAEITSYRMIDGSSASQITGSLVEQPSRISLTSDTNIELDGEVVTTTTDWMVSSLLDLEGRLTIRIPEATVDTTESDIDADDLLTSADSFDRGALANGETWSVTVDDLPAELRSVKDDQYALVSDRLTSGTMRVRFRSERLISELGQDGELLAVPLPRPAVTDVSLRGPVVVNLEGDQQRTLSFIDSPNIQRSEFSQVPRERIRLRLTVDKKGTSELVLGQAIIRSLMGSNARHDQILARATGGDVYEVNLRANPESVTIQAFVDEELVRVRLDGTKLFVPLSNGKTQHLIDLRLWLRQGSYNFLNEITPLVDLPNRSGKVYWQVVSPQDTHAVWAAPSLGREMTWRYDRWKLYRDANFNDQSLMDLVAALQNEMPSGNRYLYQGVETRAFRLFLLSRVAIWLTVGTITIVMTLLLTAAKRFRHPVILVIAFMLGCGICLVAPDGAILAGQYGLISVLLVVIMFAVRSLIQPGSRRRLFSDPVKASHPLHYSEINTSVKSVQTLELVDDVGDSKKGDGV